MELFIHNFCPGDEQKILVAMDMPDDLDERHWLLMAVVRVLEANAEADCSRLGLVAYAETPCESCRADSARLLHDQNVVPGWLAEECRFDSNLKCREIIEITA